MNNVLALLLLALLPTILFEEIVTLFWNHRSFRLFLSVALVNVLTNPVVNLMVLYAPDFFYESFLRYYLMISFMEMGVCGVEAWWFWKWNHMADFRNALLFSLTLNAISYFSGWGLDVMGYWD